ncbi:MAG: hypothetical protein ACTSVU_04255 [Promethearchaeota archaeon]
MLYQPDRFPDEPSIGSVVIFLIAFIISMIVLYFRLDLAAYRKFFRDIYVNEIGECNYHEGGLCLPGEHKL